MNDRPGRTVYDWRHYLSVIQRKPGALRNGAPFAEFPPAFKQLQSVLLKRPGGDREMVDILALVIPLGGAGDYGAKALLLFRHKDDGCDEASFS